VGHSTFYAFHSHALFAFGHRRVVVSYLVLLNHCGVGCQKFVEECEALGIGSEIILAVFKLSSSECGVLALPGV